VATIDTSTWTRLIRNATLATCAEGRPYGLIPKGAVALAGSRITWVGSKRDVPETLPKSCVVNEAHYALVTPGLIDCHTHLVWAGSRYKEFEQRLQGATYEDIAKAGGGIVNTVTATRAASEADLLTSALARASRYVAEGVTTLEVKSGYGLDKDNELKILRVARTLGKRLGINVRTTLLAAHAVPTEFKDRPDDYIKYVCDEIIPAAVAEGLADAVDAYCDTVGFTPAQVERVLIKAKEAGLGVKLHAEQFSNQQGAALAAKYKALSADHLSHLDKDGVQAMAASRTVAVLLPGASAYLRETKLPPIELLRVNRVPIAVASDLNPGSSPLASLQLNMNLACTRFGLTTEEALLGVTRNAARALGLRKALGSIEPGKIADLVIWNAEHPAELAAQFGLVRPAAVLRAGVAA
jgi:imidazolonepropionase